MTKRIIALVLTLCMTVSLLGATVSAKPLAGDLHGVMAQRNKEIALKVIRIPTGMPRSVAMPADVGDNEYQEMEPNDSYSDANLIEHDYTVYGSIEGTDLDGYVFELDTYSEVTIISLCTTDGLMYLILDPVTQEMVAQNDYFGQDEDTGLFVDGMQLALPAGQYCLVFADGYEDSLD